MPKRYGKKRRRTFKSKRRTRYKRGWRGTSTNIVKLGSNLVPKKSYATLRYAQPLDLSAAAGALTYNTYRLNSPYDPDYTGVGTSANGFTYMMDHYSHYTVVGATVKVMFLCDSDQVCTCATYVSPGAAVDTDHQNPDTIKSAHGVYYKVLRGSAGESRDKWSVTRKWSAKKFFGTPAIVGEDSYKGTQTTNPAEAAYFHVLGGASKASQTSTNTVQAWVHIAYHCVFTEPKADVIS